MDRLYGRKGFTQKKAVRTVLDGHERPPKKGAIPLVGLEPTQARRLLSLLPAEQLEDRVNDAAPTLAEMIDFVEAVPGGTLIGLRVPPEKPDERISLYGFAVPHDQVDFNTMKKVVDRGADANVRWVRHGKEVMLEVTW